jgi:hypothetical protein
MGFSHYDPLPEHLAPKVIEAARKARGEGSA